MITKLGQKNHWPKLHTAITALGVKGHTRVIRGQIVKFCYMVTKLAQKDCWLKFYTLLGHPGVIWGSKVVK